MRLTVLTMVVLSVFSSLTHAENRATFLGWIEAEKAEVNKVTNEVKKVTSEVKTRNREVKNNKSGSAELAVLEAKAKGQLAEYKLLSPKGDCLADTADEIEALGYKDKAQALRMQGAEYYEKRGFAVLKKWQIIKAKNYARKYQDLSKKYPKKLLNAIAEKGN